MTRIQTKIIPALTALIFSVSPLAAQTSPNRSAPTSEVMQLDKLNVSGSRLEDFITSVSSSGTKSSTPLIETPQAISVITRGDLDLRNPKNVGESLRYTSGISIDQYGEDPRGYDWVKIRGFDSFNSQYLDGLRMFNYEFPEVFNMERIEVMKGPSSVLYGQSTPGGLINSISKRPTTTAFGEITAEIGTHDSYETTVDFGGPLSTNENALYRLTALFRDNQQDSNGNVVNAQRVFIAPAFSWRFSEATTVTLLTSYFYGDSAQTPTFVAAPDGSPTPIAQNNKNWDYEENKIYRIGYQLEHRATANLVFRQNARVGRYDVVDKYLDAVGYSSDTVLDRTAAFFQSAGRSLAIDNQVELKLLGNRLEQTLLGGVDYGYSSAANQYYEAAAPSLDLAAPDYEVGVTAPTTVSSDTYQTNIQTGVYVQDQIKFDSHWIATLSGRHDWATSDTKDRLAGHAHNKQRDQAFSGRAGFTYLADNGLAPYVSYSNGFYPNSGLDFDGNAFDPTESQQYEIGLKYAPKGVRGTATLSLFDLTEKNVVTSDPNQPNSLKASGKWRSRGVEFESKFGVTANLDLLVSATYADIEITESNDGDQGNTPGLTPETAASTWIDYTFREGSLKGLTLGGGVRYVGSSYGDNTNTLKNGGYTAIDLVARYVRGRWVGTINLNNVTDKVQLIGDGFGYYQSAGFSLRASAAYRW